MGVLKYIHPAILKIEQPPSFGELLSINAAFFDQMLSTKDAAEFLGVTEQYLRYLRTAKAEIEFGGGPPYQDIGPEGAARPSIRYKLRDLITFGRQVTL